MTDDPGARGGEKVLTAVTDVENEAGAPDTSASDGSSGRSIHRLVDLAGELTISESRRIFEARALDLMPADQPVVLIAQPTRSGGTLLNQLCDGHPELHVHPYELEIGYPDKNTWPEIDLSESPNRWFNALREGHVATSFRRGYTKDAKIERLGLDVKQGIERFPFLLVPSYQRALFFALVKQRPPQAPRDILVAYFTSYFNAWLDNQNLTGTPKRWVIAFRSGLGSAENLEAFFRDYPEGRHLSCIREPKGWIASRMRLWGDRVDRSLDEYVDLWESLAQQRIDAKHKYGEAMFICGFDRLIGQPEAVMRAVASWLGIEYDPVLSTPTFNRRPIRANSSFDVESHGVITAPMDNWKQVLSEQEAGHVDERTAGSQERARGIAEGELRRHAA
jgi:hypothetical protein